MQSTWARPLQRFLSASSASSRLAAGSWFLSASLLARRCPPRTGRPVLVLVYNSAALHHFCMHCALLYALLSAAQSLCCSRI
jgi:hypothetical protein